MKFLDRSTGRAETALSFSGSPRRRVLSVHTNAVALFLSIVVGAGFGYLTWLVAARIATPETVGLAAAVVSAATLCSNLAILGLGITIVSFLPREIQDPASLLNGFFTIAVAAAGICGFAFLFLAARFFNRLDVLASDSRLSISFLALGIGMSVIVLLDGTSVALRRADYALLRAALSGAGRLLLLTCAALVATLSASTIVGAAAVATIAACMLGYAQLKRSFPAYRYKPHIGSWGRVALSKGLPNHILSLERLIPTLAIPLLVTELLSPSENAFWYAAWMIAFLLRFIPETTAHATLAEITNRSTSVATGVWKNMASSFVVSLLTMIALVAMAHPILGLMGRRYADAATTPLRLLALSIFPAIFIETYLLVRRATMQFREANIAFAIVAIASIAAAAYGAETHGLVGVAAGWLIIESAAGIWAAVRVTRLIRSARIDAPERGLSA
jgi:O-antigen/teichoic acid export membrane protein